jgi:hypothetical protein
MFVTNDGSIRLRRVDDPLEIGDDISNCKGLYRYGDDIAMLVKVDRDTLRGSGRSLAPEATCVLGVQPGQDRTFVGEGYSVRVTWPLTGWAGGSLGSIRDLVVSANAQLGARILLHFDTKRELIAGRLIDESVVEAAPRNRVLRELTGLDAADSTEALHVLAAAIGVDETMVRRTLRDRGDEEIASLLTEEKANVGLQLALENLAKALEQQ